MALKKCWMRELEVTLTSQLSSGKQKKVTFGNNWKQGLEDLNISISGSKYMAALKDQFIIQISNLSYKEIVELIMNKYYDIEIKAGYRSLGEPKTIFKGEVIYISNKKDSPTTNTVYILAGSKFMAKYGQSRMNLTMNSGINMWSALKYICKRSQINDSNLAIDPYFKYRLFKDAQTISSLSSSNWIDQLVDNNTYIGVNTDSSDGGSILEVLNVGNSNRRVISLNNDQIILSNGYPKVNSEGIELTILPTYNFVPLDTIVIDNSILDLSVTDTDTTQFLNADLYLDKDGKYMIFQIDYDLNNRNGSFSVTLHTKARKFYTNISQVLGYGK